MSLDNKTNINADLNGIVDKFFELNPKYQAIKIYNDEIKNNSNLSIAEKMAYMLERRKILKQAENLASTLNLVDLMLKDNGKSLEDEIPNINEDWLNYYSDVVGNFSDKEMQTIWAKILKGECENKGSISKKLINILQIIDAEIAKKFSFLCSHSLIIFDDIGKYMCPIFPRLYISDSSKNSFINSYISSLPITDTDIVDLQAIGLITYETTNSVYFYTAGSKVRTLYYDTELCIESNKNISLGKIAYTKYGNELAKLLYNDLDEHKDEKYIKFIKHFLKEINKSIKINC